MHNNYIALFGADSPDALYINAVSIDAIIPVENGRNAFTIIVLDSGSKIQVENDAEDVMRKMRVALTDIKVVEVAQGDFQ
jgi:uncharacterized protein YlzI (FlbEa/FlbD family)